MSPIKLLLCLAAAIASTANAQTSRYVTLTVRPGNTTNTLNLLAGEAAQIVSWTTEGGSYPYIVLSCQKDGVTFTNISGGVVAGPAQFQLVSFNSTKGFITFHIIPESYDPNKTLIVPPGINQVRITLETSTNLVNWTTATNGIYGSPDLARFFRIRMDQLPTP